jgi:hypothetical protein
MVSQVVRFSLSFLCEKFLIFSRFDYEFYKFE